MAAYVDVLLRELEATAVLNDRDARPLDTVYFGGGVSAASCM
jgi:coproporphyrinogen III oxidase-like Fe-S oxidoreductase